MKMTLLLLFHVPKGRIMEPGRGGCLLPRAISSAAGVGARPCLIFGKIYFIKVTDVTKVGKHFELNVPKSDSLRLLLFENSKAQHKSPLLSPECILLYEMLPNGDPSLPSSPTRFETLSPFTYSNSPVFTVTILSCFASGGLCCFIRGCVPT